MHFFVSVGGGRDKGDSDDDDDDDGDGDGDGDGGGGGGDDDADGSCLLAAGLQVCLDELWHDAAQRRVGEAGGTGGHRAEH